MPNECVEHTARDARSDETEAQGASPFAQGLSDKLVALARRRPRVMSVIRFVKSARTKAGVALAGWCLIEGLYEGERPYSLGRLSGWVAVGLVLIACGLGFRLAALGNIRKKKRLATTGVYSFCRHPLYLGSILLAYGFCMLLADAANFVLVTVYFLVFYVVTIIWEEERLSERYGEEYSIYRARTPVLLPLGGFRAGAFAWKAAMSQGGIVLMVVVLMLLAGVQVMALMI